MPGVRPCTPGAREGHHDLHAADQVYVRLHDIRAQRQAAQGQLAVGRGGGADSWTLPSFNTFPLLPTYPLLPTFPPLPTFPLLLLLFLLYAVLLGEGVQAVLREYVAASGHEPLHAPATHQRAPQ